MQLTNNFNNYPISFTKKSKRNKEKESSNPQISYREECIRIANSIKYTNKLSQPLKSTPNKDFEKKLSLIVKDPEKFQRSKVRISNLSIYLKEKMVGFIVPEYTIREQTKESFEWFNRSLEFILKGCKKNCTEYDYKPIAKEFFGLLSLYDNYWQSKDFIDYLSTLKESPAQKATIQAIKELNYSNNISFGSFSSFKYIQELLDGGCAYTGNKLRMYFPNDKYIPQPPVCPSVDHIMPKSWDGPNDEANYFLISSDANNSRGNISLLDFLKGNNSQ